MVFKWLWEYFRLILITVFLVILITKQTVDVTHRRDNQLCAPILLWLPLLDCCPNGLSVFLFDQRLC